MIAKVPGHPRQITLQRFIDFHTAKDDKERACIATNYKPSYIEKWQVPTVKKVVELFNSVCDKSRGDFKSQLKVRSGFVKKRLGIIPELSSMTMAEYADLDDLCKVAFGPKPDYKRWKDVFAILYRPVTERWGDNYNIQKYDSDKTRHYMKFIENMPLDVCFGALLFFSNLESELNESSRAYLLMKARKAMKEARAS